MRALVSHSKFRRWDERASVRARPRRAQPSLLCFPPEAVPFIDHPLILAHGDAPRVGADTAASCLSGLHRGARSTRSIRSAPRSATRPLAWRCPPSHNPETSALIASPARSTRPSSADELSPSVAGLLAAARKPDSPGADETTRPTPPQGHGQPLERDRGECVIPRTRAVRSAAAQGWLADRTLPRERLQSALARSHRNGGETGALFVDLDRFTQINDAYGHPIGDDVLVAPGSREARGGVVAWPSCSYTVVRSSSSDVATTICPTRPPRRRPIRTARPRALRRTCSSNIGRSRGKIADNAERRDIVAAHANVKRETLDGFLPQPTLDQRKPAG